LVSGLPSAKLSHLGQTSSYAPGYCMRVSTFRVYLLYRFRHPRT